MSDDHDHEHGPECKEQWVETTLLSDDDFKEHAEPLAQIAGMTLAHFGLGFVMLAPPIFKLNDAGDPVPVGIGFAVNPNTNFTQTSLIAALQYAIDSLREIEEKSLQDLLKGKEEADG